MEINGQMQSNGEIYHHGVPGMHWGVRRSHTKYGALTASGEKKATQLKKEHESLSSISTLTQKGKERKTEIQSEYKKLTGKSIATKKEETEVKKPKTLSNMSNEEIQAYNTRKGLESTYLGYQPKAQVSKGKQFAQAVATKVIAPVAIDVGKAYLTKVLKEQLKIKDTMKVKTKN